MFRNFANKLWNAGKYIQLCLSNPPSTSSTSTTPEGLEGRGPMSAEELQSLPVPERFIVSRCHAVVAEVTALLEALSFAEAGKFTRGRSR